MFAVADKTFDHNNNVYWYRINIYNVALITWLTKQPREYWVCIEFSNGWTSYIVREELLTLMQITWSKS